MKLYKSDLFGDVQEPENFTELFGVIRTNISDPTQNIRIWRGQADIDWPIHSGAYRRLLASGKSLIRERDVVTYEKHLLGLARHKGFGFENGRMLSDFELLAKLQHHGAATRLVDFSKNSLVALWFCVDAIQDRTGLLLGVHTYYIAGETEGNIKNLETDYSGFTRNVVGSDNTFFIEPPVVSPRISAQHGVFLYSQVSNDNGGSLILPNEKDATLCIAISPVLKKELHEILNETFDIRFGTMFPDLDGFSKFNSCNINTDDMWRW